MAYVSAYLTDFRRELRDTGRVKEEGFIANGTTDFWLFRSKPMTSGSLSVQADSALVPSTDYVVDWTAGNIQFNTPPTDGIVIELVYEYYLYSDSDLIMYLSRGITLTESMYTIGYALTGSGDTIDVTPAPTEDILRVWYNVAKFLIRYDNLQNRMEAAYNWSDGDVTVNEVATIQAQRGILDTLWERIIWDLQRLNIEATQGELLSGGTDPLDYGAFISSTGPQSQDYLWIDGKVDR
jgi:hypothetical protein